MKYVKLFPVKNRGNYHIIFLSAEVSQRLLKVKHNSMYIAHTAGIMLF